MRKSSRKNSKKKQSKKQSKKHSRKSSKKIYNESLCPAPIKMTNKEIHRIYTQIRRKIDSVSKKGGSEDNEKVVKEYIESLDKQLKEKKLFSFCVFPEQGFKNKMRESTEELKKLTKKEAGKHEYIACIKINTLNDQRDSILGKAGGWLYASINVIPIDKDGKWLSKKGWNTNMHWKVDDFKITKFSLKLLETLMQYVIRKKLEIAGTFGVPFNELVEELGYKKIDISSIFTPLPKLI